MKTFRNLFNLIGLIILVSQPSALFASEPSFTEYKDLLIQYSILIGAQNATDQLENLPEEGWQVLYSADANKENLAGIVMDLERIAGKKSSSVGSKAKNPMILQSISPAVEVEGEFEPKYPDSDQNSDTCASMASPCYGWYIRHDILGFPNLLFTNDTDEAGIQDDRCDEQTEAVLNYSLDDRHGLALTAQAACDFSPDFVSIGTCTAAAVAWELEYGTEQKLRVCGLHGGNVDSAESEAAYENTRTILDATNSIEDDTAIIKTTITNEENFTDDAELATHDANIDGDLAAHDANIDGDLIQHDEDIKALVANLQGAVDENQRLIKITMSRQLEIMRLLITPAGKRVINSDVLTCTGDDCPEYPALQLCPNGTLSWNCAK